MEKAPVLSIITPTFNPGINLKVAYSSLKSQSFQLFEWWVIDGDSNDGTQTWLEQMGLETPWLHWISESDNGVYDAMNKGIRKSRGEWLYFLGSDDELANGEVLNQFFSSSPPERIFAAYGNVQFRQSGVLYDGEFDCNKMLDRNICQQAIFYRRRLFDDLGLFRTEFKSRGDYEFNLRSFAHPQYPWEYFDQVVAIYNQQGISSHYYDADFEAEAEALYKKYLGHCVKANAIYRKLYRYLYYCLMEGSVSKGVRLFSRILRYTGDLYLVVTMVRMLGHRLLQGISANPNKLNR